MPMNIDKLLALANEEDGKIFVYDKLSDETFCLMSLQKYREIKNNVSVPVKSNITETPVDLGALSEEELLRKINREIAIWREQQKDKAEIILPTREDRITRPEIKKIAKDFPKMETTSSLQSAPIAKAPVLETEEEFFLEMA